MAIFLFLSFFFFLIMNARVLFCECGEVYMLQGMCSKMSFHCRLSQICDVSIICLETELYFWLKSSRVKLLAYFYRQI